MPPHFWVPQPAALAIAASLRYLCADCDSAGVLKRDDPAVCWCCGGANITRGFSSQWEGIAAHHNSAAG